MERILFFLFLAALFVPVPAHAQSGGTGVRQSGTVTPTHCAEWAGTNLIEDSGGTCGGGGGGSLAVTTTSANATFYPLFATTTGSSVSTVYVDTASPLAYNPSTSNISLAGSILASGYGSFAKGLVVSGTNSATLSNDGVIEYLNPNMRFSLPSAESYYFYNQGRGTNLLMELNGSTGSLLVPGTAAIGATSVSTGVSLDLGSTTNSLLLPTGTTAQRPTGIAGMIRYNSTTPAIEAYYNNAWNALGGGGTSSGTNLTVQLSNGSGGFSAATGILYNATTLGLNIDAVNAISLPDNGIDTTGISLGASAGLAQTTTGLNNTAVGASALAAATTGNDYVAVGTNALTTTKVGGGDVAVGFDALQNALDNTTTPGGYVAVGYEALQSTTTNLHNMAIGYQAGINSVSASGGGTGSNTGSENLFIGYQAGKNVTNAAQSIFIGNSTLGSSGNVDNDSVFIGYGIGTSGSSNDTDIGANINDSSGNDVVIGQAAKASGTAVVIGSGAGGGNCCSGPSSGVTIGYQAYSTSQTAANNTIIGYQVAKTTLTTGTNNVLIGTSSALDTGTSSTSNTIGIAAGSTAVWLATGTGTPSTADTTINGQLFVPNVSTGTNTDFACFATGNEFTLQSTACTISQRHLKENFVDIAGVAALDDLARLKPMQFNFKKTNPPNNDPNAVATQYGFIAEDVAAVDPKIAVYENDMVTPKSWRQDSVIALLVKGIQTQQKEIDALANNKPVVLGHPCFFNLLVCAD